METKINKELHSIKERGGDEAGPARSLDASPELPSTATFVDTNNKVPHITNKYAVIEAICYNSCIEKKDPTPLNLARKNAKMLLLQISRLENPQKKEMAASMIETTMQPTDEVLKASHADLDAAIRSIQTQVLLRFQFWASLGDLFVKIYCKRKCGKSKRSKRKRVQKKGQAASLHLLTDIINLLSMAAVKLPESRPFSLFLHECLDPCFSTEPASLLPKIVFQEIYDKFEIHNPANPEKQDYVPITFKPMEPLIILNKASTSVSEAENTDKAAAATTKKFKQENSSAESEVQRPLLPQAVSLVAPVSRKSNSLYSGGKNHRSLFVGSHFNTNLSNFNSLFREVKTQKKQVVRSSQGRKQQDAMVTSKERLAGGKSSSGALTQVGSKSTGTARQSQKFPKRKQAQCFHVADDAIATKKKKSVQETPRKRSKKLSKEKHQTARQVVFAARTALRRQK